MTTSFFIKQLIPHKNSKNSMIT